jgi:hypothetical protein
LNFRFLCYDHEEVFTFISYLYFFQIHSMILIFKCNFSTGHYLFHQLFQVSLSFYSLIFSIYLNAYHFSWRSAGHSSPLIQNSCAQIFWATCNSAPQLSACSNLSPIPSSYLWPSENCCYWLKPTYLSLSVYCC